MPVASKPTSLPATIATERINVFMPVSEQRGIPDDLLYPWIQGWAKLVDCVAHMFDM